MEREEIIQDLHVQIPSASGAMMGIESMARLHVRHGLYHSEGFRKRREHVRKMIREHNVDVRKELDPMVGLLYRRYFD